MSLDEAKPKTRPKYFASVNLWINKKSIIPFDHHIPKSGKL